MRGQVAIEYLILMGMAVLIVMPLLIIYFSQSLELSDQTNAALAERSINQIAEASTTVYYLGAPSSRTVNVEFPKNIVSSELQGQLIVLRLDSASGDYDYTAASATNLTGDFNVTPGPHVIRLTALDNDSVEVEVQ